MGYVLNAMIAKQAALELQVTRYQKARVVALRQDFALIPITEELRDELAACRLGTWPDPNPEFAFLPATVCEWALEISVYTAVSYIEVDLWAGAGSKAAIAWQDGEVTLGPLKTEQRWIPTNEGSVLDGPVPREDPVNRALRRLGVAADKHVDEFDALNLGRYRRTSDWG